MSDNNLGQIFTPSSIVEMMITEIDKPKDVPIIETSSGNGIFMEKLLAKGFRNIDAFEVDPEICRRDLNVKCCDFLREKIKKKYAVVIGNPPYIRNRNLNLRDKKFYKEKFETAYGQYDLYLLFFEKSIKILDDEGILCFITSNKFTTSDYGKKLRKFILDHCAILKIIDVSDLPVFANAHTYPYITILKRTTDSLKRKENKILVSKLNKQYVEFQKWAIRQQDFLKNPNYNFNIFSSRPNRGIIQKIIENTIPLGNISKIREGIHTGNIRKKVLLQHKINNKCYPVIMGRDVKSYNIQWNNKWIWYDKKNIDRSKGEYGSFPDREFYDTPKIIFRDIGKTLQSTFDDKGYYLLNTLYSMLITDRTYDPRFIVGLLNSKLLNWFFRQSFSSNHINNSYLRFKPMFVKQLPIKIIDNSNSELHWKIVRSVDKLITKKLLCAEKTKAVNAIDNDVCKLYQIDEKQYMKVVKDSMH